MAMFHVKEQIRVLQLEDHSSAGDQGRVNHKNNIHASITLFALTSHLFQHTTQQAKRTRRGTTRVIVASITTTLADPYHHDIMTYYGTTAYHGLEV